MTQVSRSLLAIAVNAAVAPVAVFAQESASITEALKAGTTKLHLRARYEAVEEETLEDAAATTLKTRLTFTSGTYQGFGLSLEMDDTTELGKDDYSDGVTNRGTAVIADPEVTEVNQAYISYSNWSSTAKYGRQRILLDNQRFVGGVGWRQDEQTYDAFTVSSKPAEGVDLFAGYVTQVNRIFGEAIDHNHETWLLNGKYTSDFGAASAYAYLIDIKDLAAVGLSSDTYGFRWAGQAGESLRYTFEYATQSEAGDAPVEYSADYILAEVGGKLPLSGASLELKVGYEVLGSDDGNKAFTTPLATLHAFQGWTDRFLATPDAGIEDTYVELSSKFGSYNVGLIYHTLAPDFGNGGDYGSEWGAVMGTQVGPVGLTLKYADYSADREAGNAPFSRDTNKLWLMAAMTF